MNQPRIVVIGGGFAGLNVVRGLAHAPVAITLIDRANHHLFQPLLYQVATADLSPADISAPIRAIVRHQANVTVVLAEVVGVDRENRKVLLQDQDAVPFDYLVIATGARENYFGHDEWRTDAPGLKTITDATAIRRKILTAFELAELERDPARRQALMTFVLIGGGPTGVELAGAIAELAHRTLVDNFRHIDTTQTRIIVVEAMNRILSAYPDHLASAARQTLEQKGVTVMTGHPVTAITAEGVQIGDQFIAAHTAIWTAGVRASAAGQWLGVPVDRAGRVLVTDHLTIADDESIFVIGDTAVVQQDGKPLPGVAPVAIQEGQFVARHLAGMVIGQPMATPFHYLNKGNLAVIGRNQAIADVGKFKVHGFIAWLLWVFVHIAYLIDFRNRVFVLSQWAWAYVTAQRGARLITVPEQEHTRTPLPA